MMSNIVCAKCHQSLATCMCLPAYTTYIPPLPQQPAQTFTFVPQLTEEQVRKIVGEEVRKALHEGEDEEEASPYPRMVRIMDKSTISVKFVYEGMVYAGEVYPVEEKYG